MKITNVSELTIVTATGKVLQTGLGGAGVLVVDSETHKPIVQVEEVSDDETVQAFLTVATGAAFGKIDFENESCDHYVIQDDKAFHEILIQRDRHEGIESPVEKAEKE